MSDSMIEKKRKFGNNIEFDSDPKNISCIFCPTSVDKASSLVD